MNDLKLRQIHYKIGTTKKWDELTCHRQQRMEYAAKLNIPHLVELMPHEGRCAIVGAAPSVKDHLNEIRALTQHKFGLVIALNGAHEFLVRNDLPPNIQIMWELDMETVEGICGGPPHKDVYYYLCSHCPIPLFQELEGYHRVLWHCFDEPPDYQALIHRLFPDEFMIGGGFVTFFRALNIAIVLGYRHFDLFGCDCSFDGTTSHFEGYQTEEIEKKFIVAAGTEDNYRLYQTTPSLSNLASEFMRFCAADNRGLKIKVHGNGLLHHLHSTDYPHFYER